jgi:recombinational DNA repair ATPase RecF
MNNPGIRRRHRFHFWAAADRHPALMFLHLLPSIFYLPPVHLDRLTLHHFRNLHGLDARFSPGLNLIAGPNGHGKSNLLEAVHFLALAHSNRTRKDKDLVAWDAPEDAGLVIRGEGTVGTRGHVQSVEYRDGGSRVKVEGQESRRLGDLLGHLLLVAFTPEDLDLLRGGPQERRRFLDVLLCWGLREKVRKSSPSVGTLSRLNSVKK